MLFLKTYLASTDLQKESEKKIQKHTHSDQTMHGFQTILAKNKFFY